MNGLRRSLLPLFLLSSAVFLGGVLFLTKNHSPYKLLYNESSFEQKAIKADGKIESSSFDWRGSFKKRGDVTVVANVENNSYLKEIGLKNGDEIIRLNSFYKPSLERTVNFLKSDKNQVVSLILKRGEKLYKIRALPPLLYNE